MVADRMIVAFQRAIIAGTVRAESHFAYQPFVLEVAERIVDGRKRDAWQYVSRALEDFNRGQMFIRVADYSKDSPALFRKSQVVEIHLL